MNLVVDHGFKPDLKEYLNPSIREFFTIWGIEPVGVPIPTLRDRQVRAAVWFGQIFNVRSETVVFVGET